MGLAKHILSYFYHSQNLAASNAELKDSIVSAVKSSIEERFASLENPSTPLSSWGEVRPTVSKIHVTEENSLAVGAVFSCVKVISETMAQMDLEVVERTGKVTKANTNHPNYWLLHAEPSPYYNRFEWVQGMVAYALLWGNGFSKIKRDRYSTAKELQIIPAWEVIGRKTERGKLFYEWRHENNTEIISSDDMIHLKNLGTDGLMGLSPIQIQRESIGNAIAKNNHEGAFYSNGARASGILMTPGNMGKTERSNIQSSFDEKTNGSKNRFSTIVLEEGVKYQQLTIPQNDAQFLESKKHERSEIAGWYRVPPYKIGDHEKSTYSNIEGQERSFAKDTIVPWTVRLQQELDRKLFFTEERGKLFTQFNLDDLIKGDMKTRYEAYQLGINGGFIKPLWAAEAEGWPTEGHPELDNFFMNGANRSVKQIITEPAAAPTQQNAA